MRFDARLLLALTLASFSGCDVGPWSYERLPDQAARYPGDPKKIDERALRTSLALAADHLCAQQLPSGLFRYEIDVRKDEENKRDNRIRQVGAFWATALLLTHPEARLTPERRQRVWRTFLRMHQWIESRTHELPGHPGALYVDLGGQVQTGGIALVALGYLERVAAGDVQYRPPLRGLLAYLAAARRTSGSFRDSYREAQGRFGGASNPYADGEAALALAKNRAVLGDHTYDDLLDAVIPALRDRWYRSDNAVDRKSFYQWGTMAFAWHARSHPDGARAWQDVILKYADWQVLEHKTLSRSRNTSYAVEGLATAFGVARSRRDRTRIRGLRFAILKTHARVMSAQFGHPLSRGNPFVRAIPEARRQAPRLLGGFLNGHADPSLRIDVTQHAIHSILLTLEHGVVASR